MILDRKRRDRLRLFEQHAPWARGIARAVARRLPPWIEMDDLEQVAGNALWDATAQFNEARGVPFRGFALRAVRGACYMAIRRREYTESTMEPLTEALPAGKHSDVAWLAEREEAIRRVIHVLATLKVAHRRVLEMHYLDGLPLTECAKRMHQKPGAIYGLKEEAMEEMRRRLNDSNRDQPTG